MSLIAVTINWRDEKSTLECVKSLLDSKHVSRIIVVDNETEGQLRDQLAQFSRVDVIVNKENLGFAAAMNSAIASAINHGGQQILAINNDATIDAESIEILYKAVTQEGFDLAAPTLINEDGSVQSTGDFVNKFGRTSGVRSKATIAEYITWACVMLKAEVVGAIGYLDTRFFMYYEDVDYSLRAHKAGLRSGVIPNAFARHSLNKSHAKAGVKIQLYTTASILAFGRKWKSEIPLAFTLGRVAIRIARQGLSARRLSLVLRACIIGWNVNEDCYKDFGSISEREHRMGKKP
jgi:N-acetylglucosaminyl-diphospho-decaprenol L-rhamnosyltransferase